MTLVENTPTVVVTPIVENPTQHDYVIFDRDQDGRYEEHVEFLADGKFSWFLDTDKDGITDEHVIYDAKGTELLREHNDGLKGFVRR